jgi:hypothetical protein
MELPSYCMNTDLIFSTKKKKKKKKTNLMEFGFSPFSNYKAGNSYFFIFSVPDLIVDLVTCCFLIEYDMTL